MWTLMPFGLIYLGLGLWCLAAPEIAAGGVDYLLQSDTARAEFITIYGGLDIGIGLAMLWCGPVPRLHGLKGLHGLRLDQMIGVFFMPEPF